MKYIHIISVSLCVLVAFCLPGNPARPVEVSTAPTATVKPVEALETPKLVEVQELASVEVEAPVEAPVAPKTYSLPDNEAKAFIYNHESGNNPSAINSIGCRGLGQACPGSKLPCGDDYACQDAWFTQYALERYGSWEAAYSWWALHSWW